MLAWLSLVSVGTKIGLPQVQGIQKMKAARSIYLQSHLDLSTFQVACE